MKYLSAKEKARDLGITTSGLAKTRHLYKHIRKSPHKYLYFAEEARDIVRPNSGPVPSTPGYSRTPRSHRRRHVPFGEENYSKCPGGSGENFKLYNQMRSKMALEGKLTKEEQESFTPALAHTVKENHKEINEQRKAKIRSELMAQEEINRKRDPSRYGGMIRGNISRTIDVQTPWKNLFETPRTEYDEALEELGEQPSKKKSYY